MIFKIHAVEMDMTLVCPFKIIEGHISRSHMGVYTRLIVTILLKVMTLNTVSRSNCGRSGVMGYVVPRITRPVDNLTWVAGVYTLLPHSHCTI